MRARLALALGAASLASACSHPQFPGEDQYGANPKLPEPQQYLFPPMGIAKPVGFKANETPTALPGFTVKAFARNLKAPRRVLPLANGDVLVVESGGPGFEPVLRPKDIIYGLVIGQAHSPVKPGNRVVLLRDGDGDGVAEKKFVIVDKLTSPFGIATIGNTLYVAATNAIWRYPFTSGGTSAGPGTMLTALPGGPIDHHWTKDLVASPDGSKLYVGIGSNSNIVENGLEAEHNRAAIWEVDPATGAHRLFAGGLRNPNGLSFRPGSNTLYTVVNERDEIGNNLVPDYLTSVKDGGFYGWPWSYYGQHVDVRVRPQRPEMVARATSPDYALGPHVAALGLAFSNGPLMPPRFQGGAFVGEHGSWDRTVFYGYQVAYVPFAGGRPTGKPVPFLTGFIDQASGKARGRPVGVALDRQGALLVADDVGHAIWRVTPAG
ncbi:sorbosone dehydrogenase family protein [Novosphingobium sp. Gsoil 351]|uniref:PQQ-dependent sugar dehydrogenase n=1 Tax=Novosphingobium sp. Gsoil 351 TaxID=2675225 RepID=UPI0012B48EBE|nr:sorbosone dehydrogenase family protein [Novosphingobium sp. Gsoil 351]QGN54549.1 sorbosone dehydrogenase family protein [Novosphingobium sp. Gsoil 351]